MLQSIVPVFATSLFVTKWWEVLWGVNDGNGEVVVLWDVVQYTGDFYLTGWFAGSGILLEDTLPEGVCMNVWTFSTSFSGYNISYYSGSSLIAPSSGFNCNIDRFVVDLWDMIWESNEQVVTTIEDFEPVVDAHFVTISGGTYGDGALAMTGEAEWYNIKDLWVWWFPDAMYASAKIQEYDGSIYAMYQTDGKIKVAHYDTNTNVRDTELGWVVSDRYARYGDIEIASDGTIYVAFSQRSEEDGYESVFNPTVKVYSGGSRVGYGADNGTVVDNVYALAHNTPANYSSLAWRTDNGAWLTSTWVYTEVFSNLSLKIIDWHPLLTYIGERRGMSQWGEIFTTGIRRPVLMKYYPATNSWDSFPEIDNTPGNDYNYQLWLWDRTQAYSRAGYWNGDGHSHPFLQIDNDGDYRRVYTRRFGWQPVQTYLYKQNRSLGNRPDLVDYEVSGINTVNYLNIPQEVVYRPQITFDKDNNGYVGIHYPNEGKIIVYKQNNHWPNWDVYATIDNVNNDSAANFSLKYVGESDRLLISYADDSEDDKATVSRINTDGSGEVILYPGVTDKTTMVGDVIYSSNDHKPYYVQQSDEGASSVWTTKTEQTWMYSTVFNISGDSQLLEWGDFITTQSWVNGISGEIVYDIYANTTCSWTAILSMTWSLQQSINLSTIGSDVRDICVKLNANTEIDNEIVVYDMKVTYFTDKKYTYSYEAKIDDQTVQNEFNNIISISWNTLPPVTDNHIFRLDKYCGDGMVQSPNDNDQYEQCDDWNDIDTDDCNNMCQRNNLSGDASVVLCKKDITTWPISGSTSGWELQLLSGGIVNYSWVTTNSSDCFSVIIDTGHYTFDEVQIQPHLSITDSVRMPLVVQSGQTTFGSFDALSWGIYQFDFINQIQPVDAIYHTTVTDWSCVDGTNQRIVTTVCDSPALYGGTACTSSTTTEYWGSCGNSWGGSNWWWWGGWWGGWWGSPRLTKDDCPNGDFSKSYYDKECGENYQQPDPTTEDVCPDGDYTDSRYDAECGNKPEVLKRWKYHDYLSALLEKHTNIQNNCRSLYPIYDKIQYTDLKHNEYRESVLDATYYCMVRWKGNKWTKTVLPFGDGITKKAELLKMVVNAVLVDNQKLPIQDKPIDPKSVSLVHSSYPHVPDNKRYYNYLYFGESRGWLQSLESTKNGKLHFDAYENITSEELTDVAQKAAKYVWRDVKLVMERKKELKRTQVIDVLVETFWLKDGHYFSNKYNNMLFLRGILKKMSTLNTPQQKEYIDNIIKVLIIIPQKKLTPLKINKNFLINVLRSLLE